MHVISTYLPPTAVTHATTAKLTTSPARYLVIAKINRVEVFSLEPEGLKQVAIYELWGRIVALEEIMPDDGPSGLLLVTDHPDPSVLILELDTKTLSLAVTDTHSLKTFFSTPLEECRPCAVDPSRTIAAVTLFQGLGHIFTFARKAGERQGKIHIFQQFDCRMRETCLISLSFLPIEDSTAPEVALLFQDKDGHRRLTSYGIDFDKKDLVNTSTMPKLNFEDEDVSTLVTIPNTNQAPGGVLVLGGSEIFFEQRGPSSVTGKRPQIIPNRQPDARLPWKGSEIIGYGFVDDDRLLLSDRFGKLRLLTLARRGPTQLTYALSVTLLGESSPAASIAYLNAGVVYLASVLGDSQLLRIQGDGRLETLDSFKSIAPIRDAVLADLDESGEPSIITCSGQGNSGGLRVIRNGVDVKELAAIDGVESIRRTFTIRDPNIKYDSYLLLSLFSQSKLVNLLGDAQFEEVTIQEFPGFSRATPTLAVQEIKDPESGLPSLVVQVLPDAALLIDMNSRRKVDEWQGRITLASCNQTATCLVLSSLEFVHLRVDHRTKKFYVKLRRLLAHPPSVLSVRPINPGEESIQVVTMGFWAEYVVKLYKLEDLTPIDGEVAGLPHAPRSVLLWKFGAKDTSRLHALIGTANGSLLIAKLEIQGTKLTVKSRRTLSLGTRPVDFEGLPETGGNVMACGSRAIVLSWEEDRERIAYHRISTKNVENVMHINTPAFPDSFLFNLGNSLSVCKFGALQKLQIDSIPLGLDNPIQVAYHPEIKVFGVGCWREEPPSAVGSGSITSSIKLIDALTYEHLSSYVCEPDEEVISVSAVDLTVDGNKQTYFAAGTMVFERDEVEPSAGRILLFEAGSQRSKLVEARGRVLTLKSVHRVGASVSAITCVDGVLVVAMSCQLGVYRLENNDLDDSLNLKPLANWTHNFLISSVVVHGHNIAIGDALQSVTILKWDGVSLKTLAKDWTPVHSLGLTVDDDYIIQSEMGRNLVSHQLVGSKLDRRGYYHVGETISKLLPGKLRIAEHDEESGVTTPAAKHLLFTSGGRISIISECNYDTGMLLQAIQRNMNEVVVGHKANPKLLSWRTPCNKLGRSDSTEMYGFIDGDFVEQYLRYSADSIEVNKILEGSSKSERLARPEPEIRAFIQNLQRG